MNRGRMAMITLLSVSLFLGLAVWGWGGFRPFLSQPALIACVVVSYLAAVIGCLSPGSISSGEREDRRNRWVLAALGVLSVIAGFLPAYTDRIGFLVIGGEGVRWAGVLLYALGCALRIWPVFVLGNRFSGLVAIQPGHTLVTDGIYRVIRNPSYLGLIVMVVGWALIFRSGIGLVLCACVLVPLVARMNAEEALLRSQFGSEYEAYRSRTWRLVPFLY